MSNTTLDDVRSVIVETLGLEDRAEPLEAGTELFGSIPELDSMMLLALVSALEERFGFEFDDEDFTGEVFETVGSLADFVQDRRE